MNEQNGRISVDQLFTVGVISGISVGIVKFTVTGFLFLQGIIKRFALMDTGAIIFRYINFPLDIFHLTLAAITYLLWGGLCGLLLSLVYLITGKNHFIIKGAFFGYLIWMVFRVFIATIALPPKGLPSTDAVTVLTIQLTHLMWGGITGLIINKYIPFDDGLYTRLQLKKE